MKILLVCEGVHGGSGWQLYARVLKTGLEKNGHEVILCSSDSGALHRPMQYLSRPWAWLIDGWRLRRLIQSVQPDIIHIAVEPFAVAATLLPRAWAEKTVVTLHGTYAAWLFRKHRLRSWMVRTGVRAIAVSNYTREQCLCLAAGDVGQPMIDVVYTGIELPAHPTKSQTTPPEVLLVGGVKPRKGVHEALRAIATYKKTHGPVHLTVVGNFDPKHSYVREAEKMIKELDLTTNVTLTGFVDQQKLEDLYAKAGLYLMPAQTYPERFEGFGLVFLEAAARGIPSIGPCDSGSAEAIEEGVTGFHVDPSNPEQIAERMKRVLVDRAISPENCRTFAEKFPVAGMIRSIEAIYSR